LSFVIAVGRNSAMTNDKSKMENGKSNASEVLSDHLHMHSQ
jgi:hypothetical protein